MRAERRSEAWLRLFCKAEWRDVDLFLEVEDGLDVALLLGVSRAELGSLLRPRRGPLRICRRLSLWLLSNVSNRMHCIPVYNVLTKR